MRTYSLLVLVPVIAAGCQPATSKVSLDNPDLAAFVNLMMPRTIEIQHGFTQPREIAESERANGVEVVLAAKDAFGDDVKCVGTFIFELYTLRMASGDRYGKRIGFWTVSINSDETMRTFWDRLSRFYNFQLQLDEGPLPPGRYILTAQLLFPTGDKLFDEYSFAWATGEKSE